MLLHHPTHVARQRVAQNNAGRRPQVGDDLLVGTTAVTNQRSQNFFKRFHIALAELLEQGVLMRLGFCKQRSNRLTPRVGLENQRAPGVSRVCAALHPAGLFHALDQLGQGGLLCKYFVGQLTDRQAVTIGQRGQQAPLHRTQASCLHLGMELAIHRVAGPSQQVRQIAIDKPRFRLRPRE